jgi:hypothetical protein
VLLAAQRADPETWTAGEALRREILRYPPAAAIAAISGPGADEFMARLGHPLGVDIVGARDGAHLLRAATRSVLADALAAVERPRDRLRIAVDPLRI